MKPDANKAFWAAQRHFMRALEYDDLGSLFYYNTETKVGYFVQEGEYAGALVDITGDQDEIIGYFFEEETE